MRTNDVAPILSRLFTELAEGATADEGGFILNRGDVGLLRSLERLSAADASRAVDGGATIAAHTQHVTYGLSLMNRWAREGGNPFANAEWDAAWRTAEVEEAQWAEIRRGLRDEVQRWLDTLKSPREASVIEVTGMAASVAHLAYHLGAIRQIHRQARGPKEGTF